MLSSFPSPRLKREECKRTKHDSIFSNWEILIGPSDWKDHSLGKEGVDRYRIHNLPISSSCPGIYELGVAAISANGSHRSHKHSSENIVVVYLGQADNVRTRLQHYGRAGSHLDNGNKNESLGPQKGPGMFREIFSRGYSIMFRWAPIQNKKEAEKTEARLLAVFDYAWNRCKNGACRREDILAKLDGVNIPVQTILKKLQLWKHQIFVKKVGIKIDTGIPSDEPGQSIGRKGFLLPRVFKFVKSQPHIVRENNAHDDHIVCGVFIGDGSVCRNLPMAGRKRCEKHKGKRISRTHSAIAKEFTAKQGDSAVCGVILEDGSVCVKYPAYGRKRCEVHKGRRVVESKSNRTKIVFIDQTCTTFRNCQHPPVEGKHNISEERDVDVAPVRNWSILHEHNCKLHEEQEAMETKLSVIHTENGLANVVCNIEEYYNICGAITSDGSLCKAIPVPGRKRCKEHKGKRHGLRSRRVI